MNRTNIVINSVDYGHKDGPVAIKYDDISNPEAKLLVEYKPDGDVEPIEDFPKALQALLPFAAQACEFPPKYFDGKDDYNQYPMSLVTGVTFKHPQGGGLLCSFRIKRRFDMYAGIVSITTPWFATTSDGSRHDKPLMYPKLLEAVDAVIDHAFRYMAGERVTVQQPLPMGGETSKAMGEFMNSVADSLHDGGSLTISSPNNSVKITHDTAKKIQNNIKQLKKSNKKGGKK